MEENSHFVIPFGSLRSDEVFDGVLINTGAKCEAERKIR
jgi:hypothetical protein